MTNETSDNLSRRQLSRRRVLASAGTAGVMGLAGCGGDGSGTATPTEGADGTDEMTGTTAAGSGEPRDDTFTVPVLDDPSNYQFNVYNFTQPFHSPMQSDLLFQRNIATREIMPYGAEFESFGDQSVTLRVRDDWTWHNGDPVTGKDVEAFFTIQKMIGRELARFIENVTSDGQTATINFNQNVGQGLLEWSIADPEGRRLASPWRLYGDWIEEWRNAGSDEAKSDVVGSMREATFDEPYGNGPFQLTEINSRHVLLEKYEDHPDADNINWQYYEHLRISGSEASALAGLEVDGNRNATVNEEVYKSFPDALQLALVPALWGQTLALNHEDKDYGKRKVRQALAYVINREEVGNNYGFTGVGTTAPSGLVGNISRTGEPSDAWKEWITSSAASKLNRYKTNDQNKQKAAELLREEGYTKEDGKWLRPNGDPLRAPIKAPADFTSALPIYRTIVSQLRQFGIEASLVTIEGSVYWPNHYLAGNFRLGTTGWTLGNPYPYFVFDFMYNIDNGFYNLPETITAPPLDNPSGEPQEVGVDDKLAQILESGDQQEVKQLHSELAWATNWYLPMIPMVEITDMVWFTTDDWEVLPSDDERHQMKWAMWFHPRKGWVQAKTQ